MNIQDELQVTIDALVQKGKGILAADESSPTIAKRFQAIDVESTEENRRAYRSLLLSTPDLGEFISGVILFEETLGQCSDDGVMLPALCVQQDIVPGVKVDKGKLPLPNAPGDEITQGLDGLELRLKGYKQQGARFAKWRDVYHINEVTPSLLAIQANAEVLARYAAICQAQGIVPIVEPEVLIDGTHSLTRCAEVSEVVFHEVFHALHRHHVVLEHMLLKPNMIVPGKLNPQQTNPHEVAVQTVRILRRTVPAAVPSINFLSGGLTPEVATANLNAMNQLDPQPWELSFSYGRALQEPALQAWKGDSANNQITQAALYQRARLNGIARYGKYTEAMECR
ncbi:class I fructose-bisphosphate aldolase [Nitrosomonas supralitoralis]|uniref:Probable fructose-bisphosphate aldolase class 1 n=1 Tax=Nitrosomonas supralitoralis TaxID=2116706 RepID=A0A2P7NS47_9PROT|nr:class I fructose-bisphosphate aldolase [Nitrosomonas supralitoralis]PSJ16292.1 fructose-bisphosphate aldolase class I [Nitrosomonas supralitoralis]